MQLGLIVAGKDHSNLRDGDPVGPVIASERAGSVIISIAVGIRTVRFKIGRRVDRPPAGVASFDCSILSPTAILVCVECVAGTLATIVDSELIWAPGVQVLATPSDSASAVSSTVGIVDRLNLYTSVESVDETDVIEVLSLVAIEGEFSQGRWWLSSCACALQLVSTVASFAVTVAIAVKRAPSSRPETSCPTVVCRYSYLLAGI